MISASALAQCRKAQGNGSDVRAPSRSGLRFPVRAGKRHAADMPSRSSHGGSGGPCHRALRPRARVAKSAAGILRYDLPVVSKTAGIRARRTGRIPAGGRGAAGGPASPSPGRQRGSRRYRGRAGAPGCARIKPPAAVRGRARSCMRAAADAVSPARRTPDGSGCRPRRRCTAPRPRCGCRRRDGRSRPAPSSRWRRCRPSSLRPAACR